MKEVSANYILQLANYRVAEQVSHVCNKFSSANAELFMQHPDFQGLCAQGRLYVARNQRGQTWFLLLEPEGSTPRFLFAQIRNSIKVSTQVSKLEQRAGAHALKAEKLWEKADAIKASVNAPKVDINFDELPF